MTTYTTLEKFCGKDLWIKVLHIDGVLLNSIDKLFFPKDLKTIYISKIQYLLNPEYFNELKKYGVSVNFGIDTELMN